MGTAAGPGRINYLRLSVTDRCNLRCRYCTYWRDWEKLPAGELLSYEERLRLAAIAGELGLAKVRITGGEPLIRRSLVDFLGKLHQVPGITKVCLTTNGVLLPKLAPALYETGLRHLNISLDTLRRERYRQITGGDHLLEVLRGLERATSLGFAPLKINCVALWGVNDDELVDIARLAREHPWQVRFIELMPTVSQQWWQRHVLPLAEVVERLSVLGLLVPSTRESTAGPARIFQVPGFQGELGFISPQNGDRCRTCNRLRLTADGKLRPCLMADAEIDLKKPLRQSRDKALLSSLFQEAILMKAGFPLTHAHHPGRSMVSLGG